MEGDCEGIVDGCLDGSSKGDCEGIIDGSWEGFFEGSCNGIVEGFFDGIVDGSLEEICEGDCEGIVVGSLEGMIEGKCNCEGTVDGWLEGICEGDCENALSTAPLRALWTHLEKTAPWTALWTAPWRVAWRAPWSVLGVSLEGIMMESDCEGIVNGSLEGRGSSRVSEIREGIVEGSLVQNSSLTSSQRQASRHSTTNQIIATYNRALTTRIKTVLSSLQGRENKNYDPWKVVLL